MEAGIQADCHSLPNGGGRNDDGERSGEKITSGGERSRLWTDWAIRPAHGLAFGGGTGYVPRAGAPPMMQTLINTLRFADRLKEAGFAAVQAEALARTLGDELTEQLPSKADFQDLRADFKTLRAEFNALDAGLTGRMDALESGLTGRMDALEI